jgi:hypothetical protein
MQAQRQRGLSFGMVLGIAVEANTCIGLPNCVTVTIWPDAPIDLAQL